MSVNEVIHLITVDHGPLVLLSVGDSEDIVWVLVGVKRRYRVVAEAFVGLIARGCFRTAM